MLVVKGIFRVSLKMKPQNNNQNHFKAKEEASKTLRVS